MLALRPQQRTALTLLGYKLWLPRAELAALRAQPAAAPPTPIAAPPVAAPVAIAPTPAAAPLILPLPGLAARLHWGRDCLWLSGDDLSSNWLLPPPWAEAGRPVIFATEDERRLLLALFTAIDCREAHHTFTALFTLARSQPLPLPQTTATSPADLAEKPLLICGDTLYAQWRADPAAFGSLPAKAYNFLHPYTVLTEASRKETWWRQWTDIRRNLF